MNIVIMLLDAPVHWRLSAMTWKALMEVGDFPAAERTYRAILESFPGAILLLNSCLRNARRLFLLLHPNNGCYFRSWHI
jgi:hypothetical protein